mgnify:CR=1 FL=1
MTAGGYCLAIDAMGGDSGPRLTVPAAIATLRDNPDLTLRLFGNAEALMPLVAGCPESLRERLLVEHCTEEVTMDDKPATALRRKRGSSMWRALGAVGDGSAQACISAGNTGALVAMAMSALGRLPGISRPAICKALPSTHGKTYLLDMGANVDSSAHHLHQFARMATHLVAVVEGIDRPSVSLLNIGSEAGKGDAVVREAAALLENDAQINYRGFVEGDGIFFGDVDVVVCDGFAGNVAVKTSEGAARYIARLLRHAFAGSWRGKMAGLLVMPLLKPLRQRLDPAIYNGATLLGLNGVVIKSHGGASMPGFCSALDLALIEARRNIPHRIREQLENGNVPANN